MSRCGHHANGSRPAAWCDGGDMRDGDLALSGGQSQIDTTNVCDRNRSLLISIPVSRTAFMQVKAYI